MLRIREIDSFDLPELAPYLTLRQPFDHYRDRQFVAEGVKVVDRLLESDLTVVSALLTRAHLDQFASRFEARPETVEVFLAEKALLERLIGFVLYQGVLVTARIPVPAELDLVCDLASRPRFLVAADALANAENLGGLVRTAVAFGAQGLVVGETCASPFLRRAVRSSMGNIFRLPVVEPVSLADAIQELRRRGFRCVGAHPHADRRLLPDAGLQGDCCIVVGSEGHGLSPEVRKACDELVAVPMASGVDSLNVGAAGAVFLYEVWRQRHAAGAVPRVVNGS